MRTVTLLKNLFETLESGTVRGSIELRLPDGERRRFGSGAPRASWKINDLAVIGRILADPELQIGETYCEGGWDAGEPGLSTLLQVLMTNYAHLRDPARLPLPALVRSVPRLIRRNGVRRSYRDVSYHYDIDGWLFRKFLDEDMQYSCAYFSRPGMSLEAAQRAKMALVRRKLQLRPGDSVLDIGCGWGGLAIYLAERDEVHVTGLTLSEEQVVVARRRAESRGALKRVRFLLQDYREHDQRYDRIVSVGMFEHVGQLNYGRFFEEVKAKLKPGGLVLLHTIGRASSPAETSSWIRKRIFPGCHLPSLSEITRGVEDARLVTTDVEVLRLHYAETLACWLARFRASRQAVRERLGERFCRTWEFYLACSEASFRVGELVVFQVQFGADPLAAPLTRDYLFDREDSSSEYPSVLTRDQPDSSSAKSSSSGPLMA